MDAYEQAKHTARVFHKRKQKSDVVHYYYDTTAGSRARKPRWVAITAWPSRSGPSSSARRRSRLTRS